MPFFGAHKIVRLHDDTFFSSHQLLVDIGTDTPTTKQIPFVVLNSKIEKAGDITGVENVFVHQDVIIGDAQQLMRKSTTSSSVTSFPIIIAKNFANFEKAKLEGQHAEDFECYTNRVIGFVDGRLVFSMNQHTFPRAKPLFQTPSENKTSLTFRKLRELPNDKGNHSPLESLIAFPSPDNSVYGLVWLSKVYLYSRSTDKFSPIGDLPVKVNSTNTFKHHEGRAFGIDGGYLTEIVKDEGEGEGKGLKAIKHLPWLDSVTNIVSLGDAGLLITSGYGTESSVLIYVPSAVGTDPLDGVVRTLPAEFVKPSATYLWSNSKKAVFALEFSRKDPEGDDQTFTLASHTSLDSQSIAQLPSKLVRELFSPEALARDSTFAAYEPTETDLKGLQPSANLLQQYKDNISPLLKVVRNFSMPKNTYRLIAGWKVDEFPQLNELKYEGRYVTLQNFEDLGDYIGAPIFYKQRSYRPTNRVEAGILAQFEKQKRSSKSIILVHSDSQFSSGSAHLTANNLEWIGVAAYDPNAPVGEQNKGEQIKGGKGLGLGRPSVRKTDPIVPDNKKTKLRPGQVDAEFDVVSGSLRVCDPGYDAATASRCGVVLPFAKDGTWFVKYKSKEGRVAQVIAFHSEYLEDPVASDWSIPQGTYQNPDAKEEDTPREVRDIKGNKFEPLKDTTSQWTHVASNGVGVDTARAGFFDFSHYYDDSVFITGDEPPKEGWEKHYTFDWRESLWLEHVDELPYGGINDIPYGVVSQSGYGDGCYACLIKTVPPSFTQEQLASADFHVQIVAAKIVFITDNS